MGVDAAYDGTGKAASRPLGSMAIGLAVAASIGLFGMAATIRARLSIADLVPVWTLQATAPWVLAFVIASVLLAVTFQQRRFRLPKVFGGGGDDDDGPQRWLTRTLFRVDGSAPEHTLSATARELVSVVAPVGTRWVFGKACRSGATGWIPQSALESVDNDKAPDIERERLRVQFRDDHFPDSSTPAPLPLATGIIWCVIVINPDRRIASGVSLGASSGHVAIVEMSPGRRSVRVGGPAPVDIDEPSSGTVDGDTIANLFAWVHTRLEPLRSVVIIEGTPSPCPAISGEWNGEASPAWVSLDILSAHLQRVHLRCEIALLVVHQTTRATLQTLHALYNCCRVLVAPQTCQAALSSPSTPLDLIHTLSTRPEADAEDLAATVSRGSSMTEMYTRAYPEVAVALKTFLTVTSSVLSLADDGERTALREHVSPWIHDSDASGAMIDRYVDVVGFCSAVVRVFPEVSELGRLLDDLVTAMADMVVLRDRTQTFCGLSMFMPVWASPVDHARMRIMSQWNTYVDEMKLFYAFYDVTPRLHARLDTPGKSIQGSDGKQHRARDSKTEVDPAEKRFLRRKNGNRGMTR
ncbi:SH3 domain-containing protein [Plasmodiophora brassicae]